MVILIKKLLFIFNYMQFRGTLCPISIRNKVESRDVKYHLLFILYNFYPNSNHINFIHMYRAANEKIKQIFY